jgi:hypothetical protein
LFCLSTAAAAHDDDNDGNYGDERRTSSSHEKYNLDARRCHSQTAGEKIESAAVRRAVSFLFPQVRKPAISWRRTDRQRSTPNYSFVLRRAALAT